MYANKTVRLEDNLWMFFDSSTGVLTFFSNSLVKLETIMYHIYNRSLFAQVYTKVVLNNTDITQLCNRVVKETVAYENGDKRLILFPYPGSENRYIVLRAFHTGECKKASLFPQVGEILSVEELKERKYVRK